MPFIQGTDGGVDSRLAVRLVTIKGAPHGLLWTHGKEVNRALVEFLAQAEIAKESVSEVRH